MPKDCHNSPAIARGIRSKTAHCLALLPGVQELKAFELNKKSDPGTVRRDRGGGRPARKRLAALLRRAAFGADGWIVLNREVAYVSELRGSSRAPMFAVTADHLETGRIQGRLLNALLPHGGTVV